MSYTIFYSWQSDTERAINRDFIRKALEGAVQHLSEAGGVEDAPRVDSGMEGVAGSPDVAAVMFDKIRDAGIFVGDLTLVGNIATASDHPKRVPNPNVLLELGYAAAMLGWGRVIGVMNEHFGSAMDQPFDVRNRRFPIRYRLAPDATADRDAQLKALTHTLQVALQTAVDAEYRAATAAVSRLDVGCRSLIGAFGTRPRFSEPNPNAFSLGGALDTPRFMAATARLLDLGIIRAVRDTGSGGFEYEWTFLGRHVLRQIGAGQ